jgi:hypothetical protein
LIWVSFVIVLEFRRREETIVSEDFNGFGACTSLMSGSGGEESNGDSLSS